MHLAIHDRADGIHGAARRIERRLEGAGAENRILVYTSPRSMLRPSLFSVHPDALDIFWCVVDRDLLQRCRTSRNRPHLRCQARAIEELLDAPDNCQRRGMWLR